jgi:hypothetical protein
MRFILNHHLLACYENIILSTEKLRKKFQS